MCLLSVLTPVLALIVPGGILHVFALLRIPQFAAGVAAGLLARGGHLRMGGNLAADCLSVLLLASFVACAVVTLEYGHVRTDRLGRLSVPFGVHAAALPPHVGSGAHRAGRRRCHARRPLHTSASRAGSRVLLAVLRAPARHVLVRLDREGARSLRRRRPTAERSIRLVRVPDVGARSGGLRLRWRRRAGALCRRSARTVLHQQAFRCSSSVVHTTAVNMHALLAYPAANNYYYARE
jgi:hypothetical protein